MAVWPIELGSEAQQERHRRILDATMAIASKGGYRPNQMRAIGRSRDVAVGTPASISLKVPCWCRRWDARVRTHRRAKTDRTVVAGGTSYQRLSFMVNKLKPGNTAQTRC